MTKRDLKPDEEWLAVVTRFMPNTHAWAYITEVLKRSDFPQRDHMRIRDMIWSRRAQPPPQPVVIKPRLEPKPLERKVIDMALPELIKRRGKVNLAATKQHEAEVNLEAINAAKLLAEGAAKTRVALNAGTTIFRLNRWLQNREKEHGRNTD